jgi:TolA-binding protein
LAEGDVASTTEEGLYQQCKSAYTAGKYTDASRYIGKFLSRYPESDHAGEMLFMQAFLQPAVDASIEKHLLITRKYPNSKWAGEAHFQLGQCHYLQGKYDEALDHYGKIIVSYSENETYWPALYWKCKSLMAKGDYEKAITTLCFLEDSSSTEIGKDMLLMSLGNCYFGMQDYQDAATSYRSLIKSMPHSNWVGSAYLLLAKSLQNLGKLEEAKKSYQKVINDYHQSIEAQQAQRCLDSLSLADSKAAGATDASPTQTTSYFTIQVGAFSKKPNADSLAERLRRKGYSVNIARPIPGKSRLYRVRIGKFKTKSAASNAARRLSKSEKLDAEVVQQ